jgi:hypothetical protein
MTVVNMHTGEIVDLDRAAAERRAERITLRLDAIADNYRAVMPMIREAIEKRDDMALGYRSPGDYVSDRFGQSLAGLGIEVRRAVVGELTAAGLSTRAIAPVVGVTRQMVSKDIAAGGNRVATSQNPQGEDAQAAVDPIPPLTREDDEQGPATAPEPRPAAPCARPEATTVTGIDGKAYPKPTPRATPRKPITDAFRDRLYDLTLKAESLHRLIEDDRWSTNAKKLATAKNRNELLRINDLLEQVANAITENEVTP